MPHETLDFGSRSNLTELMDEPCSREDLRACLRDIARLNRWFLAYQPLLGWLDSLSLASGGEPVRILDVGSGYGDGLRRIERWAKARGIAVELTGLDLNRDAISIAAEASPASSHIDWVGANVFSFEPLSPFDVIVSCQFTHHLSDSDVVRFLKWMERNARVGWFISDLSRNAVPYQLLKIFAWVMGLHPFVQHDGPVSIARAFVNEDWERLCSAAGLNFNEISIEGFTPARLCVGRRKSL
jgi:2-polyprenyl-3-methyl-5-hydroxy-6-metoxy-1,4-benzoquinol methylase